MNGILKNVPELNPDKFGVLLKPRDTYLLCSIADLIQLSSLTNCGNTASMSPKSGRKNCKKITSAHHKARLQQLQSPDSSAGSLFMLMSGFRSNFFFIGPTGSKFLFFLSR